MASGERLLVEKTMRNAGEPATSHRPITAEQLARLAVDGNNDLYFDGVRMTNEIRLDRYGRFLATIATVSMVFWAFGTFATGIKNGSDFLYGCHGTPAVVVPQVSSSGAVSVR